MKIAKYTHHNFDLILILHNFTIINSDFISFPIISSMHFVHIINVLILSFILLSLFILMLSISITMLFIMTSSTLLIKTVMISLSHQ